MGKRVRLDQHLVDTGYYETRSRARDAIARGAIRIGGTVATRPATTVAEDTQIEIRDEARDYVSRAALKLKAGIDATGHDPAGRICLDIGASTGGFTQVLLEAGAKRVFAVDVGHDQLHSSVRSDPRVVNLEGINARDLRRDHLRDAPIEFIVCDVSFISLKLALPRALALAEPGSPGIFLVKPQFELGRKALTKAGIVRDEAAALAVAEELRDWLDAQPGWRSTHLIASPIAGGDGNREFLLGAVKDR